MDETTLAKLISDEFCISFIICIENISTEFSMFPFYFDAEDYLILFDKIFGESDTPDAQWLLKSGFSSMQKILSYINEAGCYTRRKIEHYTFN